MAKVNRMSSCVVTGLFALIKDSCGEYYFEDYLEAREKCCYGSFLINITLNSDVKILVIDGELKSIEKTFDYVNRFPSEENIKSICKSNQYDYVFMLYFCKESGLLKTKVLNDPNV